MFQLDYGDHRPLYEQIKDKIKELIVGGVLKENDKVPSVRELASVLAINPNTIQKAYKDFDTEGYIYSQRAKGSFVSPLSAVVKNADTGELFEKLDAVLQEMYFLKVPYDEIIKHIENNYRKD